MKSPEDILVPPVTPIREAIRVIDSSALQIALVVDDQRRILGTVTDGDIRRSILKGVGLEESVEQVMNPTPVVASRNDTREDILSLMKQTRLHQVPIVDERRMVLGVEILDDLLEPPERDNLVVIMAGGLGNRLRPLTNDCPKPLLPVGDKPILETILENFVECGFRNFCFSVRYKSHMVEDYFGDGSTWGVRIQYVREKHPMGTAGSLSRLPERPSGSMIVMNGDLLTKVNFQHLLNFHEEQGAQATMCVGEYDFQVPYGVVNVQDHRLVSIEEKPVHRFFVNAGIYVIEPDVLELLPADSYFDMPDLFAKAISGDMNAAVFPIREYWLDIGRLEDYERAGDDYRGVFQDAGEG